MAACVESRDYTPRPTHCRNCVQNFAIPKTKRDSVPHSGDWRLTANRLLSLADHKLIPVARVHWFGTKG